MKGLKLIYIDSRNYLYVAGSTLSPHYNGATKFPVFQNNLIYSQEENYDNAYNIFTNSDGFISCFSDYNGLLFSTYFGGRGNDDCRAVFVRSGGEMYVCGSTEAGSMFPVNMPNPSFQCCSAVGLGNLDVYISELNVSHLIRINEMNGIGSSIHLYPNPVHDFLYLKGLPLESEEISYQVSDLLGKILKQGNYTKKSQDAVLEIGIGDVLPGVYLAQIKTKDGILYSKKFIKVF